MQHDDSDGFGDDLDGEGDVGALLDADDEQPLYEAVRELLLEDGWAYVEHADHGVLRLSVDGKYATFKCFARAQDGIEVLNFYVVLVATVPESSRPAVAEFLTRANWGFRIGAFEMDFSDGEVRFRAGVDLEGAPLEAAQPVFRQMLAACVMTADRYFPGLMSVVYGGADPKAAIQQVEQAN